MDNTLEVLMHTEIKKLLLSKCHAFNQELENMYYVLTTLVEVWERKKAKLRNTEYKLAVECSTVECSCMNMSCKTKVPSEEQYQHSLTHRNYSWLVAVWSEVARGFCFQNRCSQDPLLIHSDHCSIVPSTSRQTMDQLCTVEIGIEKNNLSCHWIGNFNSEIFCYQVIKLNFTSPHLSKLQT